MHKAVTGAFIGGVVGAGVAAFQAKSSDAATEDRCPRSPRARPRARWPAGASARSCSGGSTARTRDVGLRGMSRRAAPARRPRARRACSTRPRPSLPHVEELADRAHVGLFGLADAARPHVESLADVAREKAFDLAELAIDAARPHAETAAEVAGRAERRPRGQRRPTGREAA